MWEETYISALSGRGCLESHPKCTHLRCVGSGRQNGTSNVFTKDKTDRVIRKNERGAVACVNNALRPPVPVSHRASAPPASNAFEIYYRNCYESTCVDVLIAPLPTPTLWAISTLPLHQGVGGENPPSRKKSFKGQLQKWKQNADRTEGVILSSPPNGKRKWVKGVLPFPFEPLGGNTACSRRVRCSCAGHPWGQIQRKT